MSLQILTLHLLHHVLHKSPLTPHYAAILSVFRTFVPLLCEETWQIPIHLPHISEDLPQSLKVFYPTYFIHSSYQNLQGCYFCLFLLDYCLFQNGPQSVSKRCTVTYTQQVQSQGGTQLVFPLLEVDE